jgi:hypothetical protein
MVGRVGRVLGLQAESKVLLVDANQWFDETHFENYRTLGHAAGASAAEAIHAGISRIMTR